MVMTLMESEPARYCDSRLELRAPQIEVRYVSFIPDNDFRRHAVVRHYGSIRVE